MPVRQDKKTKNEQWKVIEIDLGPTTCEILPSVAFLPTTFEKRTFNSLLITLVFERRYQLV